MLLGHDPAYVNTSPKTASDDCFEMRNSMSLTDSDKTSRNRLRLLVLAFGLMFALTPMLGQAQDGAVPIEPEIVEAGAGTAMPSLWDLAVQAGCS